MRLFVIRVLSSIGEFQLPHPVRGATERFAPTVGQSSISTPAPCEGCDAMLYEMTNNKNEFQLPHPVRGATVTSDGHALAGGISTPAPCEGCDRKDRSMQFSTSISTPAPCEECDSHKFDTLRKKWQFQLPHPVRGATLRSFSICSFLYFNSRTL